MQKKKSNSFLIRSRAELCVNQVPRYKKMESLSAFTAGQSWSFVSSDLHWDLWHYYSEHACEWQTCIDFKVKGEDTSTPKVSPTTSARNTSIQTSANRSLCKFDMSDRFEPHCSLETFLTFTSLRPSKALRIICSIIIHEEPISLLTFSS